jgi:hypothetical protein
VLLLGLCTLVKMPTDFAALTENTMQSPSAKKTTFDGTKLPLVVGPSHNHNIWYEVSFSLAFFTRNRSYASTVIRSQ